MNRNTLTSLVASLAAAAIAVGLALWSIRHQAPPPEEPLPAPAQDTVKPCAARLQKLGKALRLYAADNDGAFPIADTPAKADEWLPKVLKDYGITPPDLRCPTSGETGPPYVYHCYRELGADGWPRWMRPEHLLTLDSPPETWLAADFIHVDGPGPHSTTDKAFNYLTADGRVTFHVGRPREVYK